MYPFLQEQKSFTEKPDAACLFYEAFFVIEELPIVAVSHYKGE
jgi:hypothetical protein